MKDVGSVKGSGFVNVAPGGDSPKTRKREDYLSNYDRDFPLAELGARHVELLLAKKVVLSDALKRVISEIAQIRLKDRENPVLKILQKNKSQVKLTP